MKHCFAFLFLLLLATGCFAQEKPEKSTKFGPAIQLGAGHLYAGNIGLLGEWQIKLKDKIRFTPCLSGGIAEGGTDSTSHSYYWLGFTAGANFEFGNKHRFICGPQYINNTLLLGSVEIKKSNLNAASFILGYKGVADFGLMWTIYIGDLYIQDPYVDDEKFSHTSHLGLGLGYKF